MARQPGPDSSSTATRIDGLLRAADQSFNTGDTAGALTTLLKVWAHRPAAPLADLILTLGQRLAPTTQIVNGRSVTERNANWHALADTKDPAALHTLLTEPWPRQWKHAAERVEKLSRFERDPRISTACMALIHDNPYPSGPARAFWPDVLSLLVQQADPSTVQPFLALRDTLLRRVKTHIVENVNLAYGYTLQMAVKDRVTDLSESSLRHISQMAARLEDDEGLPSALTEDEMIDAIRQQPEAVEARLVYADWLSEQGDPRGEFISLQCQPQTAQSARRIKSLLRKHGATWVPEALRPIVEAKSAVFERGFLAECTLKPRSGPGLVNSTGNPAWHTVHKITLPDYGLAGPTSAQLAAFLNAPSTAALTVLHGAKSRHLISRHEAVARLIDVGLDGSSPGHLSASFWACAPNLKHLTFMHFLQRRPSRGPTWAPDLETHFGGILEQTAKHSLETLTLGLTGGCLGHVLSALQQQPGALREVWLIDDAVRLEAKAKGWWLSLQRDDSGQFETLVATWVGSASASSEKQTLVQAMESLQAGALSRLVITDSAAFAKNEALSEACAAATAQAGRLGIQV